MIGPDHYLEAERLSAPRLRSDSTLPVAGRVPAQRDPELSLRLAAAAGDRAAFGELVAAHHRTAYRYIRSRVTSREVAEDLTQQTALRALAGAANFREQGRPFGAWLVTIARNLVTDYWKSAHYQRSMPVEPGDQVLAEAQGHLLGPAEDPAEVAAAGAAARVLRGALPRLTPGQQQVLQLRFWAGLTIAETAQRMGRTVEAVKVLQSRAVLALGREPQVRALGPAGPPADGYAFRRAVRTWAAGRGVDVPQRGRLSPRLVAAYRAAHPVRGGGAGG